MAAGYDGTIRIDTRIDGRGFNTGIKSLIRTVKSFAAIVGVAFGVGAIVKFGSTAVNEASTLASALIGLQSVVSGQGKSFSEAQAFIDDYIADGLVPATNAITAYKNLALRGYDTSQIQETMTILKDTAAFGRQASLSMGEAVQSATEGLKNENSILVDNAGVTKNVAKMWKDYADSLGVSVSSLTQQQKIEAEMIGLRQESIYQTGDAAKMADTYAGKVAGLSNAFYKLKVGIGNIFIPILQKIIPVITTIVNWLTALANRAAQVIQILLGVKVSVGGYEDAADGANAAADAQDNLAGATEEAGKAAKGALAPFDELNVLQQDTGSGSGSGGVDTGGIGGVDLTEEPSGISEGLDGLNEKLAPTAEAIDRLMTALEPVKAFVAQGLMDFYNNFLVPVGAWVLGEGLPRFIDAITEGLGGVDWENINLSLDGLWTSLAPFAINMGEGLLWLWENVLVPFGTWVLNDAVPVFLDLLEGSLDVLNATIEALKPLGTWLWENFLQPAAEWVGDAIISDLENLVGRFTDISNWISANQGTVETIAIIIGSLAAAWWLVNAAVTAWNVISGVGAAVTTAFGAAMAFLTSPIFLIALAIGAVIAIVILLVKHWDKVKEVGIAVWEWMKQAWTDIVEWVKTAVANIGVFFTNLWTTITDWAANTINSIGAFFSGLWTDITDWAANAVNSIGQFFTDLWEGIKGIWGTVTTWFQTAIFDPLSEAFTTVLDWIGEKWETVFTGIQDFVKGVINAIIDFINGMIRAIVTGINAIINGINSLAITLPNLKIFGEWAGMTIGFDIPNIAAPQIPRLATGAVIPPNSAFAAILGDQRSGYNLEGPEDRFRQIVREELADILGSDNINITMPVYLDSEKIYEGQKKVQRRRGTSLVTGGLVG